MRSCRFAVVALVLVVLLGARASSAPGAAATAIHATEGTVFSGLVDTFSCSPGTPTPTNISIDWGDKTSPSTGTVTVINSTCQISGSHTYAEEGSYATSITYNLGGPAPSTDVGSATVVDVQPNANSGSGVSVVVGHPFSATVATFTDPAPEPLSSYSATIAWGDGISSAGSIASGYSVSGSHTYANGGTYAITVTIHDEGGATATPHDSAVVSGCTTVAPTTPSPPFDPPATDLNARYVEALYHDLFGRTPSPSDLSSANYALAHGLTRAQLVLALDSSTEYRNDLVQSAYKHLLGVAPSPATATFLVGLLNGGTSDEQMIGTIAGSPEYFAARGHSSNDGFLTALYCDAVYRPIDQPTQHADDGALGSGTTRTQVASGLLTSSEYLGQDVGAYYLRFLRRTAGSAALNNWIASIQGGGSDEKVVQALLSSTEYYNEFNPTVTAVTTLSAQGTIHTSISSYATLKMTVLKLVPKHRTSEVRVVPPRTSIVGVVNFGKHRKGRVTLHWNRRVRGKRLSRGKYVAVLRAYHKRKLVYVSDALPFRVR